MGQRDGRKGSPIEGSFPSRQRVLAAERRRGEGVRSPHVGLHPSSVLRSCIALGKILNHSVLQLPFCRVGIRSHYEDCRTVLAHDHHDYFSRPSGRNAPNTWHPSPLSLDHNGNMDVYSCLGLHYFRHVHNILRNRVGATRNAFAVEMAGMERKAGWGTWVPTPVLPPTTSTISLPFFRMF